MPAHSTHICQLLDVAIFAALMKSYYKPIEYRSRSGFAHADKLDFLKALRHTHMETFKSTSLQNGLATAGIVPFNPERVLANLNIQLKTPTPPSSSHDTQSSCLQTPSNPHELRRHSTTVKRRLEPLFSSLSNPTFTALD
jgi:hypothetical protein